MRKRNPFLSLETGFFLTFMQQRIPSAVALILNKKSNQTKEILFTKRSETLEHHKGQISFPGGVKEQNDSSLLDTAIRETKEELGLILNEQEKILELPSLPTFSSPFIVTPFVFETNRLNLNTLRLSTDEISEVFLAPLDHFLDEKNIKIEHLERNGVIYKLTVYYFATYRIWGATAKILESYLRVIS